MDGSSDETVLAGGGQSDAASGGSRSGGYDY